MGMTDCVRCGNPLDPTDPQPCEEGGLCERVVESTPGYVITDLGGNGQEVYPATMQRRSFLAVDPATAQDPDVMGFLIVTTDEDFATGHQVVTVDQERVQEPPRMWADQITTDQWRGYLEGGELP